MTLLITAVLYPTAGPAFCLTPSCITDVLLVYLKRVQKGTRGFGLTQVWGSHFATSPPGGSRKTRRHVQWGPRGPSVDSGGDQPHHLWEPLPWHSGQIWTIPNQGRLAVECSAEVNLHFFRVSAQCHLSEPTLTIAYKRSISSPLPGTPFSPYLALFTWHLMCVEGFLVVVNFVGGDLDPVVPSLESKFHEGRIFVIFTAISLRYAWDIVVRNVS